MTWNELGWFAASLMPALVIITYIGVAISAIRECRLHLRQTIRAGRTSEAGGTFRRQQQKLSSKTN